MIAGSHPPTLIGKSPQGFDVEFTGARGLVAMQVNTDGSLTIELRPGEQDPSRFTGFSDSKRIYRR